MKKFVAICGISGVSLYILSAILGQVLNPGYDPMIRTISMLVYIGAPHKLLFDTLFIISNFLLLFFSVGLFVLLQKSLSVRIGSILLTIAAILQVILFAFLPVQSMYAKMSTVDRIHQNIVNITIVLLIVAIVFLGYGLFKFLNQKRYLVYSISTSILLFLVGLVTSHEVTSRSDFRGLWERIMIGIFLQWIVVTSIQIYNSKKHN